MNVFSKIFKKNIVLTGVFILAVIILLFFKIGSYGLWDPWEMQRTYVAKKMASPLKILVAEKKNEIYSALIEKLKTDVLLESTGSEKEGLTSRENPLEVARIRLNESVFHILVIEEIEENLKEKVRLLDTIKAKNPDLKIILLFKEGNENELKNTLLEEWFSLVFSKASLLYPLEKELSIEKKNEIKISLKDDEPLFRDTSIVNLKKGFLPLINEIENSKGLQAFKASFKRGGETNYIPSFMPFLTSLMFKVFGFNEASARLPSVILSLFTIGLIFLFSKENLKFSLLTGTILLTSPLFLINSRGVQYEMGLSFSLTLAMVFFYKNIFQGHSFLKTFLIVLGAILSYLSVGFTGLLIIILIILPYILLTMDFKKSSVIPLSIISTIFIALLLITFLPDKWNYFYHFKFVTPTFGDRGSFQELSFDYFIRQIGFGFFPWAIFLPFSISMLFLSSDNEKQLRINIFLVLWALSPFVVLSVMLKYFHHFLYPSIPALAIITATFLNREFEKKSYGKFIAFISFGLFLVLAKDLFQSPKPFADILAFAPFLKVEKGTYLFPQEVKLSFGDKIIILALGFLVLNFYTNLSLYLAKLPSLLKEKKAFRIALIITSILWLVNIIATFAIKYSYLFLKGREEIEISFTKALLKVLFLTPHIIFIYFVFILLLFNRYRYPLKKLKDFFHLSAFINKIFSFKISEKLATHKFFIVTFIFFSFLFSLKLCFAIMKELSYHLSQKQIIETYKNSKKKIDGEIFKHGIFTTSGEEETNFYTSQIKEMPTRGDVIKVLSEKNKRTFFILPKNSFSEINHSYRKAGAKEHIAVLDARSFKFILVSNILAKGEKNSNWIENAVKKEEELYGMEGFKKSFVNFNNKINFLGYFIEKDSASRGSSVEIKMAFKCIEELNTSYRIFMHIDKRGAGNRIHGDHWPLNLIKETEGNENCVGCFSTTHWLKNDVVIDTYKIEIPMGSPSGSYDIWIGFYNPGSEERLKVLDFDKRTITHDGDNRVRIGVLIVE